MAKVHDQVHTLLICEFGIPTAVLLSRQSAVALMMERSSGRGFCGFFTVLVSF